MTAGKTLIGLTGSIGMGKSTVAAFFAECGAAVWDADDTVHRLYAPNGAGTRAIREISKEFVTDDGVDRAVLSEAIQDNPDLLNTIERVIHPLVAKDRADFVKNSQAAALVFDIPLLFENRSSNQFTKTVVVSCDSDIQRTRVLARPGMTEKKFELILSKQMPDADKRKRADFIVETDGSLEDTRRQVERIYEELIGE